MRLISLKISNFRVIKDAHLEFPDKVIGIIGPNGAGKSSIIEAIAWALYGNQAARSGKDEIKSNFESKSSICQVDLTFTINEEKFRVIRRITGKTDRVEVELYRGDASESVGVSETKNYIGELLGLDWSGFKSSFLARQQELNALSDLQPSKRKDHLAGMLGIEKLDKAMQYAKQDTKLYANQTEFLERQLLSASQIEASIKELSQRIVEAAQNEAKGKSKFEVIEKVFKETSANFVEQQARKNKWVHFTANLDSSQKSIELFKNRQITNRSEFDELQILQKEKEAISHKLKNHQSLIDEFEQLKEIRSKVEYLNQLKNQKKTLLHDIAELQNKDSKTTDTISLKQTESKKIPDDIDSQLKEHKHELELTREKYSESKADFDSFNRELAKLQKQLGSIGELGSETICDRCLRPLGNDLPSIKKHLETELELILSQKRAAEAKLEKNKIAGIALKEKLLAIEKDFELKKRLAHELEALAKEKEIFELNLKNLNLRLKEIDGKLSSEKDVSFNEAVFAELQTKVEQAQKNQLRLKQVEGSLERLPKLTEEIKETELKIAEFQKQVEAVHKQIDDLGFSEKGFTELHQLFEEKQVEFENSREEYRQSQNVHLLVKKELEGKLEQKETLKKSEDELEETRTARYHTEKLASLFSEYRSHLISRIRPTLSDLSGRLIAEMTAGKYNMVELDEKYNLRILDYGDYFGVERFSGGEKDLANLCLRLAISLSLTEAAGMARSFIILDEVFGSQDSSRRELIVQSLGNLKNRFPQILLISHLEDIKDKVEMLIEVTPTAAGYSEVRVNEEIT